MAPDSLPPFFVDSNLYTVYYVSEASLTIERSYYMELALIYSIFLIALLYSALKDRGKTRRAFMVARNVFIKMMPVLLIIVGLVGLLLGFIPPETIEQYLGDEAGLGGTISAAIIGSLVFIPNLVAVPLAGSLLRSGAAIMTMATFITTLTMVGTVTAPLEIKELGLRYTLLRNLLGFLFAILVGIGVGLILS